MSEKTQTIEVRQIGDQYEATVPGIGAKVTGSTLDVVLSEAQRAIVANMIEATKKKRKPRGKGRIA
ncbi:MAG TPA: hypothetical protein VF844_12965 [Ktedonobacteraceae bacterium]